MTIHREGRRTLLALLVILAGFDVILYGGGVQGLAFLIIFLATVIFYLLVLQFFRSPKVVPPTDPNKILSPADGKVVAIEETFESEFLNEKRRQISIFMSPLNVHINRMPVGGAIQYVKYHPGKYLVAWHPKSSTENERTTLVVKTENGLSILFRQIAGAMARRIRWYVQEGQSIGQGEEFGFIKFGSRVDVFIPLDAKISVKIGDKTRAGITTLAILHTAGH